MWSKLSGLVGIEGRACGAMWFVLAAVAHAQPAASAEAPVYEAHLWVGQTRFQGGQNETGLRSLELAVWPSEGLRLFVRHDDGLARDNAAVALSDRNSAQDSVGAYRRWNTRTGTLLELGGRKLVDGGDRSMVHLKQSFYLDHDRRVEVGTSLGRRSDGLKDWLVYLGSSVPVAPAWRLEPVLFVSRDGLPGHSEVRMHLASQYQLADRWELGGGLTQGSIRTPGLRQQVREGYLKASYRTTSNQRLNVLLRRESVEGGDSMSVLAVGTTLEWR